MIIASVVAAALPVMAYVVFIWWLDRYEREPFWLVVSTFVYGATVSVGIALDGNQLLAALTNSDFADLAQYIAPIVEEPAKASILFILLLSRNFDNTTDGLVYGAAAGLGFAMTENYLYFRQGYEVGGQQVWWQLVVLRSTMTALMHCAASATFGAFIGAFRYHSRRKQWLVGPLIGYGVSVIIHYGFNSSMLRNQGDVGLGLVVVAGFTLFVVTQGVLALEHSQLRRALTKESEAGVLPLLHAQTIPYYLKRKRPEWLEGYEHVDREPYIEAATKLAFRLDQARRPGCPPQVSGEVEALRATIAEMLAAPQKHRDA